MARRKNENPAPAGKTISARVSAARFDQLEEYRWDNRMSMSELITSILESWALTEFGEEAPAETDNLA